MKVRKLLIFFVLAIVTFISACSPKNADAEAFIKKLYIANHNEMAGSFALPKYVEGNREVPVTWSSSKPEIIVIEEYPEWDEAIDDDFRELYIQARVNLSSEEVEVVLTANITYKKQVAKREMPIIVVANQYKVLSASAAKLEAKDTLVEVRGKVAMAADSGYIVEDDSGYLYVYKSGHGLKVGYEVIVRGKMDFYNLMPQIASSVVEKISQDKDYDPYKNLETKTLASVMDTPSTNKDFFCSIFTISGVVRETSSTDFPYEFIDPVNLSKLVNVTKYSNAKALNELKAAVGNYVEAVVMIYSYRNDQYNLLYVENSLKVKTYNYTDEEYTSIALQMAQEKYAGMLVTGDLTFDAKIGKTDHIADLTWKSLNTDVISDAGKVTLQDDDIKVKLEITATYKGITETGTVEVLVKKLAPTPIAELISLTPATSKDEKPIILVEGVVVGYQFKGYWVADETGAILVYTSNIIDPGKNAPNVGDVVQVKGGLTTYGEANYFTSQIAPIGAYVVLDKAAPKVIDVVEVTFDEIFALGLDSWEGAQAAAATYYGKFIKVTGKLVRPGSNENYWELQNPNKPNEWIMMNNLNSNKVLVALRDADNPPTVTITLMVRELYFKNDTSTYDNFRAGTFGAIYFNDEDVVALTPAQ